MNREHTAYIEGVSVWSPVLPCWDDACRILRGDMMPPQASAKRPAPGLLPPNERRRAPDTVAISLEVASKACAHAGREPVNLPSVFSSTHGDLAVTDYMCETLAQAPALISPTKFHNSVHNAAAGYWAIATGCMRPYTALSASHYSFANGLLEALLQAQSSNEALLYVAYDIDARGPLAQVVESTGQLGCALVLNCGPSEHAKFVLRWKVENRTQMCNSGANTENTKLVAGNATSPALALLEPLALSGGHSSCALGDKLCLELTMEPVGKETGEAA
jgi:Beta-ketoacyl synthase, N-terminal domain